jgi:hypothetical protein
VGQQLLRTAVQSLFLVSGVITILLPAPCPGMVVRPFYVGVSTCRLAAQAILVAGTLWDWRDRHALMGRVSAEDAMNPECRRSS